MQNVPKETALKNTQHWLQLSGFTSAIVGYSIEKEEKNATGGEWGTEPRRFQIVFGK